LLGSRQSSIRPEGPFPTSPPQHNSPPSISHRRPHHKPYLTPAPFSFRRCLLLSQLRRPPLLRAADSPPPTPLAPPPASTTSLPLPQPPPSPIRPTRPSYLPSPPLYVRPVLAARSNGGVRCGGGHKEARLGLLSPSDGAAARRLLP
jgi:hypothetical protein